MEPITKEWIRQNVLVKSNDDPLENYIREKMNPEYKRIVSALQSYLRKETYIVEGVSFSITLDFNLHDIEDALGKKVGTSQVGEAYWKVYEDWFATYFPCVEGVDFAVYYMMIVFKV